LSLRELDDLEPRRSREHSRDNRHQDGGRTRHRRDVESGGRSANASRNRTTSEDQRRRHEDIRQSTRQIEHQSSLRSLISSSDMDSQEIADEVMRQIGEEGLLDGIDLSNLDGAQEEEILERIAEAYRRRQRERSRAHSSRHNDIPNLSAVSDSEDPSSGRQHHSRSRSAVGSATNPASQQSGNLLEVQSNTEGRQRRRTSSDSRAHASSSATRSARTTEPNRSPGRSATDL